jgi:hypothetical protein
MLVDMLKTADKQGRSIEQRITDLEDLPKALGTVRAIHDEIC